MSSSMPPPNLTLDPPHFPSGGPITITGPLSIAELLDRTFRALRTRFGVLILSAAIILVPLGVTTALISGRFITGYFDLLQIWFTEPDNVDFLLEQFLGNFLGYFGAIVLISILSAVGTSLVTLMSFHHIERFLHGETSTVAEGWRAATRRLLPALGMTILEFIIIGFVTAVIGLIVGVMLFIVALVFGGAMAGLNNEAASIILGIGLIIALLIGYLLLIVLLLAPTAYFSGRWIAAAPSLLIEGLGPIAALRRSWMLTKGHIWRSLIFIVLLTLFSTIVIGIPVAFTQQLAMLIMPSQLALITVLSTAASYILNLFYRPFHATGVVLFYYDLRVRAEAYDVTLRVAALEAEIAPDAPAA